MAAKSPRELNAFTTPDFITWLDEKMLAHGGKLIPPPEVLGTTLTERLQARLRGDYKSRIGSSGRSQVRKAEAELSERVDQLVTELPELVAIVLDDNPSRHWSAVTEEIADSFMSEVAKPK